MSPVGDIFSGFALPFHFSQFWILSGGWILVVGFVGFFMMGADKEKALHGQWRISEMNLLFVAYIGGFWGILLGTQAFHHKTSSMIFMALTWGGTLTFLWIYVLSQAVSIYGLPFMS